MPTSISQEGSRDLFNGAGWMQVSVKVRAEPKGEVRQHARAAAVKAPLRQFKPRVSGDRV